MPINSKAMKLVKQIAPQINNSDDFTEELLSRHISNDGPVCQLADLMVEEIVSGDPESLQDKINGALGFMFVLGRIAADKVH